MKKILFIFLILILFYTRFVNLGWGLPYPMHPDERNMAVAIQQLSCPNDMRADTRVRPYQLLTTDYNLKECFNPHFFAYGQLPLYLAYGGVQLSHLLTGQMGPPTFIEATLALRAIAALASIALVIILIKILELLIPKKRLSDLQTFRLLTLAFLIFQPYSIQLSHFGTTESLLMLFYSLIVYFSLKLLSDLKTFRPSTIFYLGLFSGLALGTKISSILFLGVPLLVLFIKIIGGSCGRAPDTRGFPSFGRALAGRTATDRIYYFCQLLIFCIITFIFFILSSPHSFLNWADFISSMNYESAVGLGTYLPFYTRQFSGTIPLLFQFEKILPYVLGWPTLIGGVLGFFLLPSYSWNIVKKIIFHCIFQVTRLKGPKKHAQSSASRLSKLWRTFWEVSIVTESEKSIHIMFDVLRFALLLSFLPSSFFFAKWTRFIAPSFPLFSILALLFFMHYAKKSIKIITIIIVITILPGLAYLSIYTSPDIRFTASEWIYKNIPANSKILSETANVIDLPIPTTNNPQPITHLINSFNFYDLDANPQLQQDLTSAIQNADYIIVPSRRIFKNHTATNYALLTTYYSDLFSGASGFEKVAEFSSFPNLSFRLLAFSFKLPFPDEEAEETWTVFDHPVIRIYKKSQKSKVESQRSKKEKELDFSQYSSTTFRLSDLKTFRLLVADTPAKWEKGLMYVKNKQDIGGMDGMLFIFPESQPRTFWNMNTLSNLTLYWINNKKIIGTSDMPSITESGIIKTFSSPSPANTVIEIIK